MAKPDHAIAIEVLENCQIDLEALQAYSAVPAESTYKKCYMYAITRIPVAPREMRGGTQDGFARPRFMLGSSGVDDVGVSYKSISNSAGYPWSLGGTVLGPAEARYYTTASFPAWRQVADSESPSYGVIEIELEHQNVSATQDALAIHGIGCYMQAREDYQTDPVAMDSLEMILADHPCEYFDHASAWDMMSGFALSLNTLTYLNSGGFGTGVFASPFWGWPEEGGFG